MADRDLEHLLRPHSAGFGLEVFSVDDTAAQIVWSTLPRAADTLEIAGRTRHLSHDGRPGAIVIDGLAADALQTLRLRAGTDPLSLRTFRTLPTPAGPELFRFATISDLHLGRGHRGYRGPFAHPVPDEDGESSSAGSPTGAAVADDAGSIDTGSIDTGSIDDPPLICARAAIAEALEWGAQLLVVKGDVCEETYDHPWDQAAELLSDLPIPVLILPGNHDTGRLRHCEPEEAAASRGLRVTRGVEHVDLPGLRLVLADSTVPGSGWGRVRAAP